MLLNLTVQARQQRLEFLQIGQVKGVRRHGAPELNVVVGERIDAPQAFEHFYTFFPRDGKMLQVRQGAAGPAGTIDHLVQAVKKLRLQRWAFDINGDAPQCGHLQRLQIQDRRPCSQVILQLAGLVAPKPRHCPELVNIGFFQRAPANRRLLGCHLLTHVAVQVSMGLAIKIGAGFVLTLILQDIEQRADARIDLQHLLTRVGIQ
ncbi:hypothetical protein PFLmoz3_06021 [Pseudomonas fluorescens]|uniref:Uncharacterized protein n=1 Tax=Pseudomonas fluorescens TaxID=294 RepID=A0A109LAL0_PSEFL|nr:hypothetical protein PFLmoz3_06021 [Pseudomonas fluorescens]